MKLFCWSTAQASSSVTRFMRSKMSSETLGRPSGKRSPCHSGVYLMTSSRVKNPCCANALGAVTAMRLKNRIAREKQFRLFFIVSFAPIFSGLARFKPGCSRDLSFSGDFFVHFKPNAWLVRHCDVALLDDFAFLDPVFPK